jgi:hypothetical protein
MEPTSLDPDSGVVFPLEGETRSTTATGRAVLVDAVRAQDPGLAAEIERERDWRSGYLASYRRVTTLEAASATAACEVAAAGLASVAGRFRFRRHGQDQPLAEALGRGLADSGDPALHPVTLTGTGVAPSGALSVPYRGARLAGSQLDRALDGWVASGAAEPSLAEAVRAVRDHPQWLDLRDVTVVALGAAAEMGPVPSLLAWGAHVVAVDLPDVRRWTRLVDLARSSPGRLTVPLGRWLPESAGDDEIAAEAGADLVRQTPELLGWLAGLDGPLTLGQYVYADGAMHVRTSVAVDALTSALLAARSDVSLAFLATPTDAFVVPEEVVAGSRERYEQRSGLRRLARPATLGRLFEPNYPDTIAGPGGRELGLADSLVAQQGPNYALAKRIQRWRATQERMAGRRVSLNVAPATRTRSVMRNRILAAAYAGAHRFGVEVFEPVTSNTVMAALLVHDLRSPASLADPANRLAHPAELTWQAAMHGGLWRQPYAPRSVLGLAVMLGAVRRDG